MPWTDDSEIIRIIEDHNTEYRHVYENEKTAGLLLFKRNGKEYRICNDSNVLIIGQPGCGKTSGPILDFLADLVKNGESGLVYSPKNDFEFIIEFAKKHGYIVYHINLRDPEHSDAFSALSYEYQDFRSSSALRNISAYESMFHRAATLIPDKYDSDDPFWATFARSAYQAIEKFLFVNAPSEEYVNEQSMATLINGAGHSPRSPMKQAFRHIDLEDERHKSYKNQLSAYAQEMAPDTGNSVKAFLEIAESSTNCSPPPMAHLFCSNSTNIYDDIRNNKKVLFLITGKDETSLYKEAISSTISYLIDLSIRVAEEFNGRLPRRFNFLIDELYTLSPIADLDYLISSARSRNIRLVLCCQNLSQIKQLYGEDVADIIINNIQNQLYFSTNDFDTMDRISKLCGMEDKILQHSYGVSHYQTPLIGIGDIKSMKRRQCIIFIEGAKYVWNYPNSYLRHDVQQIMRDYKKKNNHPRKRRVSPDVKIFSWEDALRREKEKQHQFYEHLSADEGPDPATVHPDDSASNEKIDIDKILKEIDEELERLSKEEENNKAGSSENNENQSTENE